MDVLPTLSKTAAPAAEISMAVAAMHAGFNGNTVTRICALVVTTLGALVLAGWFSGIAWLATLGSGFAMAPNTALAFVLAGIALYAHAAGQVSGTFRWLPALGALGVTLVGGLTAAQYWFGADFHIDTLLAMDAQSIVRTRFPQRMSEITAVLLLLLGISLFALQTRSRAGIVLAQLLSPVAFIGAIVALVGYTYSTDDFQTLPYFAGIAPHTIAALIAISVGVLLARSATSGLETWPGFRRIGFQLLLLVLAAALPLAIVIALSIYYEAAQAKARAIVTLQEVARGVRDDSVAFLGRSREQLAYLAQRPLVRALDRSRCDPLITEMQRMNSQITAVTLVDARGDVVCWSLAQSTSGVTYSDRDWYRNGITAGGFRVGTPIFGRALKELVVPLTVPVMDKYNKPAGVLNFATSMLEISRLTENRKLPAGWVVTVISREGLVLARSLDGGQWLGKTVRQDPGIMKQLEQGEGVVTLAGLDGIDYIYAFTTLKDTGWLLSAAVPTASLLAPQHQKLFRISVIAALVIALVSGITWFIFISIRRPIRSLQDAAQAVSRGELETRAVVDGPLEIASVAIEFNRMAAARQQYESDLVQQQARDKLQAEQIEAANKELEAFAYSVSHDLRVPLRAIDGFSHMVEKRYRDKLDDEGRRLIQVVRDNARKMGQLIDDILAFSRMGRKEMTQVEVNMANLARAATEELAPDSAARKFELRIGELPPARGDAAMLRQVWINLIGNAIKFSRTKEAARIEIGAHSAADEQVYYVQDNGVGFDMEYAAKLFGVFQRLHGVDEFEGTGIGLAIVKRIITRHGGRVWAEGKVNEGATIYFALPKLDEPSMQDDAPAQHETGVML